MCVCGWGVVLPHLLILAAIVRRHGEARGGRQAGGHARRGGLVARRGEGRYDDLRPSGGAATACWAGGWWKMRRARQRGGGGSGRRPRTSTGFGARLGAAGEGEIEGAGDAEAETDGTESERGVSGGD